MNTKSFTFKIALCTFCLGVALCVLAAEASTSTSPVLGGSRKLLADTREEALLKELEAYKSKNKDMEENITKLKKKQQKAKAELHRRETETAGPTSAPTFSPTFAFTPTPVMGGHDD